MQAEAALRDLLRRHKRVVIAGVPGAGKTRLADTVRARAVIHTDDWKDLPWDAAPARIREACEPHKSFVVEGVRALAAIREGLEVDAVLWLNDPHPEATDVHWPTVKGRRTNYRKWRAPAGVEVVEV